MIFNTLSITARSARVSSRRCGPSAPRASSDALGRHRGTGDGLLASVVGLFAGLGLAKLLTAIGGDLPEVGLVFTLRTVLVSLALGTVITLLASVMPALRATRVPPIAAVREGRRSRPHATRRTRKRRPPA